MTNIDIKALTEGDTVTDKGYNSWGEGECVKALKTVWMVRYKHGVETYDKQHLQFLTKVIKKDKIIKHSWTNRAVAIVVLAHRHNVTFKQIGIYLGRTKASIKSTHHRYKNGKYTINKMILIDNCISELLSSWSTINERILACDNEAIKTKANRFILASRRNGSNGPYELTTNVLTEQEAIKRIESSNVDTIAFELIQTKIKTKTIVTKNLVTI